MWFLTSSLLSFSECKSRDRRAFQQLLPYCPLCWTALSSVAARMWFPTSSTCFCCFLSQNAVMPVVVGRFPQKDWNFEGKGKWWTRQWRVGTVICLCFPSTYISVPGLASSLEVDGKEASKLFGFCKQPSSFLLICSAKFLREAQTMKSQDARRRVGNSSWEVSRQWGKMRRKSDDDWWVCLDIRQG